MDFLNSPTALALLAEVSQPIAAKLDTAAAYSVIDAAAAAYAGQSVSVRAAAAIQTWAETSDADLGEGEGRADRLIAMLVGIVDEDKDGELSPEEQTVFEAAANAAWDYAASKGVSEDDLSTLFNGEADESNGAADRIMEFLADNLPDGDEAAMDDADEFSFGNEATDAAFDAVYKKRFAVRNGKKRIVMKRVAGHVRLSAKQKVAIRKMLNKSHGSKATMKRMKSVRIRRRMGL